MDRLVEEKNLGLAGAKAEQIAGLYDAFFQIMRRCNSVGDLDFAVKLDWGDPFVSRLLGAPPLPDYTYEQRLSKTNELCLSREGMESVLSRDTPWYCEKSGWVDKL